MERRKDTAQEWYDSLTSAQQSYIAEHICRNDNLIVSIASLAYTMRYYWPQKEDYPKSAESEIDRRIMQDTLF